MSPMTAADGLQASSQAKRSCSKLVVVGFATLPLVSLLQLRWGAHAEAEREGPGLGVMLPADRRWAQTSPWSEYLACERGGADWNGA